MAAELVGTAYVRIRAITAGLGSDISDGLDKGVKDAGPDIDKSGQDVGDRLGDGTKDGFGKSVGDGSMGDSVTDALDAPDVHRDVEKSGGSYSKDTKRGFDKESKRKNPFSSLLDSLDKIGDAIPTGGAKLWGSLFSPQIVQAFAPLISSVIAGTVSALGVLATSAAGAGVALIGAAGLAAPVFGVLLAALKADTEELDKFKEVAKDLVSPWKQVAVATQRQLLPGIESFLRATQQLVPLFTEFGSVIGEQAGAFAAFAGGILTSERNVDALADVLDRSTGFFEDMGAAGLALLDSFLPLLQSAAPIAEQLAISLRGMAENFRDFVVAGNESGELRATFQSWFENLEKVAGIIGNLATALWNVLQIGSDAGSGLLDRIAEVTQKWEDFTTSVEGQNAIKEWFDASKPVLEELWGLLGDIAAIFVKPLVFGGVEGNQGTVDFIRTIRTDWLPTFKRLSDSLAGQGLGDALKRLADAFVEVIDKLSGSGTLSSTVSTLAAALELMAKALDNPVFQTVFPYIFATAGALKALSLVTGPIRSLASVLPLLTKALTLLGGGSAVAGLATFGVVIAAIAVAVGGFILVWKNFDTITAAIQSVWEWLSNLNPVLRTFLIIMGGFLLLTNPLTLAAAALYGLVAAIKNFDSIVEAFGGAWEAVTGFISGIPELLAGLPAMFATLGTSIVDALSGLPALLGGVGESILSFFEGLPDLIGGFLEGLPDLIGESLGNAMRALPGLMLDALSGLGALGGLLLGLIADGLQNALPRLAEFFVKLPVRILGFIGNIASALLPVGGQILGAVLMGLVKALPRVLLFFVKLPIEIATLVRKGIRALLEIGFDMIVGLVQGLIDAFPRIRAWFADLPANIVSGVASAATWLIQTGLLILQGLLNGLVSNLGTITGWFAQLPGIIQGLLSGAASFLVNAGAEFLWGLLAGAQSVLASLNEFFAGIPQQALTALGDIFGFLWTNIVAGSVSFIENVGTWVTDTVATFATLPGLALSAIGDLGATIWGAISGGMASVVSNAAGWVADMVSTIGRLVTEGPGALAALASNVGAKIIEMASTALSEATSFVTQTAAEIGRLITEGPSALASLASNIASKITEAAFTAVSAASGLVTDVVGEIAKLPGRVISALSGFAGQVKDAVVGALKSGVNAAIDTANNLIPDSFGFGPFSIDFPDNPIPRWNALGGIFNRPTMRPEGFGEAGAEALIPMTRPSRALALLQQSGLDQLVLQAYLGRPGAGATVGGAVTMLHIENATIASQTDADVLVQQAATSYRRLAG